MTLSPLNLSRPLNFRACATSCPKQLARVLAVFPEAPHAAVAADISATRSAHLTSNNILEGRVHGATAQSQRSIGGGGGGGSLGDGGEGVVGGVGTTLRRPGGGVVFDRRGDEAEGDQEGEMESEERAGLVKGQVSSVGTDGVRSVQLGYGAGMQSDPGNPPTQPSSCSSWSPPPPPVSTRVPVPLLSCFCVAVMEDRRSCF